MHDTTPLIEVNGLQTQFFTDEGVVRSVEGVDFTIPAGKTLCVVGESGSGKSVTARSILRIENPGRIVGGEILYHKDGEVIDLARIGPKTRQIRQIRGRDIAMIFQEPMSALSPVHTIGDQIVEALTLHFPISKDEAKRRAIEVLGRVGIPKAADRFGAYTFELSGGMRQRVCIAMALSCEPRLLIADEPTTALDVTTQANILDLIADLQKETGMAVMFITHDLGVVAEIADEVAVMYLGQVMERGDVDSIFHDPKHPYTRALLDSIPRLGQRGAHRLASIRGMVPHPFDRPSGCPFHTRCDSYMPGRCNRIDPPAVSFGPGREAKCLLHTKEEGVA
ncbi:ABC transporter ATP-binding protein [Oceaniglobus trochenteri]|uniref:ABC transporter ATP-binding protein n=1 Tax=Oceaniglobus trochenteri TaxID=2763260 RepID=UPI001CFFA646|nr:ABC transporter ATP-binding protein [Oceaniglobus trochenteri]